MILNVLFGLQNSNQCFGSPQANGQAVLSARQLEQQIYQFFQNQQPVKVEKLKIEIKNLPESISIKKLPYQVNFRIMSSRRIRGNVILQVEFTHGGRIFEKFNCRVQVQTFEKAVVVQQYVARHDVIPTSALKIVTCETTDFDGNIIRALKDAEGMRAKRQLSAGTILSMDEVEPIPLIRRGDTVILLVKVRNLTVTAKGKALADGCKNEIIRVKNLDTQKQLKGKVIAERQVLIRM